MSGADASPTSGGGEEGADLKLFREMRAALRLHKFALVLSESNPVKFHNKPPVTVVEFGVDADGKLVERGASPKTLPLMVFATMALQVFIEAQESQIYASAEALGELRQASQGPN